MNKLHRSFRPIVQYAQPLFCGKVLPYVGIGVPQIEQIVATPEVIEKALPKIKIHDPIPSIARSLHQEWPEMDQASAFLPSGS